jgi:hypothetical protein
MKLCECGCGELAPIAPQTIRKRGHVRGQPLRFVRGHSLTAFNRSPEHRAHLSRIKKGNTYRLGKKHTAEARRKMSLGQRGKSRNQGEKHGLWKGDDVSYFALHSWVLRHKTKAGKCSTCPYVGRTEWANISGVYLRDLEDFAEMCQLCHIEFDNWLEQFFDD